MNSSAMFNTGVTFDAKTIADNYAVSFTPFYIVTYLLTGLGTVIISVTVINALYLQIKAKENLVGVKSYVNY